MGPVAAGDLNPCPTPSPRRDSKYNPLLDRSSFLNIVSRLTSACGQQSHGMACRRLPTLSDFVQIGGNRPARRNGTFQVPTLQRNAEEMGETVKVAVGTEITR